MRPLKSIVSGKTSTVLMDFYTSFHGVSKEMDGKTSIFRVNLGM